MKDEHMALDALPGGDQSVLGALPEPLQACLSRAARVVLIANNPAITVADFQALNIGVDDVVVSFNTCIKAPLLDSRSVNVSCRQTRRTRIFVPALGRRQRLLLSGERFFTMLVAVPHRFVAARVACTGSHSAAPLWNDPSRRAASATFALQRFNRCAVRLVARHACTPISS